MNRLFLLAFMMLSVLGIRAQQHTFQAGNKTFLLDGKPFVVKAAELHYPRIPQPYWEHRIKMCKSLGMNTICIYVFWNIHEQREGVFDFTANNDVAEFCRLCQKNGMYSNLYGMERYSENPTHGIQLAGAVAEFGMLLKDSQYKGDSSFDYIIKTADSIGGSNEKIAELAELAETVSKWLT